MLWEGCFYFDTQYEWLPKVSAMVKLVYFSLTKKSLFVSLIYTNKHSNKNLTVEKKDEFLYI